MVINDIKFGSSGDDIVGKSIFFACGWSGVRIAFVTWLFFLHSKLKHLELNNFLIRGERTCELNNIFIKNSSNSIMRFVGPDDLIVAWGYKVWWDIFRKMHLALVISMLNFLRWSGLD